MDRKLALLTMHYPESKDNRFHPDPCYLDLTIYALKEPSVKSFVVSEVQEVEDRILMQLSNSRIVAAKTFDDEKGLRDIALELASKYNGVETGGYGGVEWTASFRLTSMDLILKDYFGL